MSQKDKMTPMERKKAIDEGRAYDRIPCVPFMSELKCTLSGVSIWDYWHDGAKMAQAESMLYHRYGYDRIVIGPNTRGIAEAFGAEFVYPEKSTPYIKESFLKDYEMLEQMNVICAAGNPNGDFPGSGPSVERRTRNGRSDRNEYRRSVYDCFHAAGIGAYVKRLSEEAGRASQAAASDYGQSEKLHRYGGGVWHGNRNGGAYGKSCADRGAHV